jgi:hypothetical protein
MTNVESAPSPGAPPPEERRRSPRFTADMAVAVSTAEETIEGRVKDICREAFLMEAERSFRRETVVSVVLRLPEPEPPLTVKGKVARLGPTRQGVMAVLFQEPDSSALERLDDLLGTLKPEPAEPST